MRKSIAKEATKPQLLKYIDDLVVKIEGLEQDYSKYYVVWDDGEVIPCNDFAEVEKTVGQVELEHLNKQSVIKGKKLDFCLSLEEAA